MSRLTFCLLQLLLTHPGLGLDQLYSLAGDDQRAIRTRLKRLADQGWAVTDDQVHWSLTAEGVLVAQAEADKAKVPLHERAWQAIRHLKNTDITQLMRVVAQPEDKNVRSRLTSYFNKLDLVGLVIRARNVKPSRYVLVNDPGPKAPRVRDSGVFDPNSGAVRKFQRGAR